LILDNALFEKKLSFSTSKIVIFLPGKKKTNTVEDVGTISRKASQHIPVTEQVKLVSFLNTEIEMQTKL